jgi:hypothetical protein
MFSAGFNQKTTKGDLFIKRNYGILPWKLCEKVPEDCRRLLTKGDHIYLTYGATRSLVSPIVSLFATSVLHRLLGCISVVISSCFDPRAKD